MKNDIDLVTIMVGFFSAFYKALKKGLKWIDVIVAGITGAIFSFGVIGILVYFLPNVSHNLHIIIAVSYAIGRITDGVIEKLDTTPEVFFNIFIEWCKNKFNKNDNTTKGKSENP